LSPNTKGNEVSPEFCGFDDKILSMYALGLTTRQIQEHLKEMYAVEVSPELISRVTDEVKELADEWRRRADRFSRSHCRGVPQD
jgi:transposase-like protein